jgi:hypothetical protein
MAPDEWNESVAFDTEVRWLNFKEKRKELLEKLYDMDRIMYDKDHYIPEPCPDNPTHPKGATGWMYVHSREVWTSYP